MIGLIDRYSRHINYLRISITDHCNLRCIYCQPNKSSPKLPQKEILTYEEILHLVGLCVSLGISKVRITGGEPLIRKGVFDFLTKLAKIKGLEDVSLTTNGVLLKSNLDRIKSAGIRRINISLDTLMRKKYKEITGYDLFDQVWEGIVLAQKKGFYPIKINVVALNGTNDNELTEFAKLSFSYPFHIRFIEYMPFGTKDININKQLLTPEIIKQIQSIGELIEVKNGVNDGPVKRYKFYNAAGEIGFISPISHHFCDKCNRLRLTASGRLRSCLLSDHELDIKGPLRNKASNKELSEIFQKAVSFKSYKHNLSQNSSPVISGRMHAIGG